MSPTQWFNSSGSGADVFYVYSSGSIYNNGVRSTFGLRPIINLRSDVEFNGDGTGTQSNPYIVKGAE